MKITNKNNVYVVIMQRTYNKHTNITILLNEKNKDEVVLTLVEKNKTEVEFKNPLYFNQSETGAAKAALTAFLAMKGENDEV